MTFLLLDDEDTSVHSGDDEKEFNKILLNAAGGPKKYFELI
jgi:hypothetical protein